MMRRIDFSSITRLMGRITAPTSAPPTIQVWAPDDVRDYTLRRENGEGDKSYEERKSFFDALLTRGGR